VAGVFPVVARAERGHSVGRALSADCAPFADRAMFTNRGDVAARGLRRGVVLVQKTSVP